MTPAKTHPIDDDNTDASNTEDEVTSKVSFNRPREHITPEPPESKRQTSGDSEKSHETVEESGPGQEPVPPPSPSSPRPLIRTSLLTDVAAAPPLALTGPMSAAEGPVNTSLQRHQTVDDEICHFKSLMQRCQTEESDSQPGAHHVEGPHLDILVEDGDSDPSTDEHEEEEERRSVRHVPDDQGGLDGNTSEEEDPFAEPYNVPSAYLVADEELGQSPPPPVTDPMCVTTSDFVPALTVPTVSMVTNFSGNGVEEDENGGGDPTKKKDEKSKSGCTLKVPCCELGLSTPFLVAIAVVGIIVAIIVIVLGAKYANGGGENKGSVALEPEDGMEDTPDTPTVPDIPNIVDPGANDPGGNRPIVDISDIDFSEDAGGDEDPEQPPKEPEDGHDELCNSGNNGGCDPLTTCTDGDGGYVICGPCPDGYEGNGQDGCKIVETTDTGGTPVDDILEVLTDCSWQKLLAADGEPDKRFGQHVAIAGDLLAVGAARDNEGRGSVYVYERSDVSQCCWSFWFQPPQDFKWKYTIKLTAPDGKPGDTFTFVDISQNTIAVGAKNADVDGKEDSGAVYIWTRDDGNAWSLEQKLAPDDLNEGDLFSNNLALQGDRLIVTARLHDGAQPGGGAAYFFRRRNGKWKLEQKLMPEDIAPNDEFGSRAVIQGDRAVISAYKADGLARDSGVVYVYKYNEDDKEWRQEAKLTPDDGSTPHAFFGINLAIDEDNILVGAYNDTQKGITEDGEGAGAAYVYSLSSSGEWIQTAKLFAADGEPGHNFGRQVALNGNVMVVSSLANYLLPMSGALYIYRRTSEGNWEQQSKLMTNHIVEDSFGSDIALDGLTILAGARYDTDNGYRSGSAYIIDLC